jgi:hypothetical protein
MIERSIVIFFNGLSFAFSEEFYKPILDLFGELVFVIAVVVAWFLVIFREGRFTDTNCRRV